MTSLQIWDTFGLGFGFTGSIVILLPILLRKLQNHPRYLPEDAKIVSKFTYVGAILLAIGFLIQIIVKFTET